MDKRKRMRIMKENKLHIQKPRYTQLSLVCSLQWYAMLQKDTGTGSPSCNAVDHRTLPVPSPENQRDPASMGCIYGVQKWPTRKEQMNNWSNITKMTESTMQEKVCCVKKRKRKKPTKVEETTATYRTSNASTEISKMKTKTDHKMHENPATHGKTEPNRMTLRAVQFCQQWCNDETATTVIKKNTTVTRAQKTTNNKHKGPWLLCPNRLVYLGILVFTAQPFFKLGLQPHIQIVQLVYCINTWSFMVGLQLGREIWLVEEVSRSHTSIRVRNFHGSSGYWKYTSLVYQICILEDYTKP